MLRLESQDFDYIENFAKTYGNSLKSVLFEACLGVDDIETTLKALALRKPRIQYNHYFYSTEREFHFKRKSTVIERRKL